MYVELGITLSEDGRLTITANAAGEAFICFEDDRLDLCYAGDTKPAAEVAADLRKLADAVELAARMATEANI